MENSYIDGMGIDIYSFIRNDEVYRLKDWNPFGMVVSIGIKFIKVRRHSDGKEVKLLPTDLHVGKSWQRVNKVYPKPRQV